jgi:hypothetical protein
VADLTINNNIIASASRNRASQEALRARDAERRISETATSEKAAELLKRQEIATEISKRSAQALRDRRNDIETDVDQARKLSGQQDVLDSIDSDTRYRAVRDQITSDLRFARDDEEAIKALIDSEAEEALALDAIDDFRAELNSRPDISTFLSDREQRLTLRQQQERDFQVQQRIDLRIASDNINTFSPNPTGQSDNVARGSIVDVSG